MRTIICVTGLSLASGGPNAPGIPIGIDQGTDAYRNALWSRINALPGGDQADRASVETASLRRLGLGQDDEVVLLAPDTPEHALCTEVIQYFVIERMGLPTTSRHIGDLLAILDENRLRATAAGRTISLLVAGADSTILKTLTEYAATHQMETIPPTEDQNRMSKRSRV